MEVRTFVRIQKVIWDHLLASKKDHFRLHAEHHAVNNYRVVIFFLSRVRDKPKNVCVGGYS